MADLTLDVSDSLSITDSDIAGVGLSKSDIQTLVDSMAQAFGLNKSDVLSLVDVMSAIRGKDIFDSVVLAESIELFIPSVVAVAYVGDNQYYINTSRIE